jgi:predicted amidophosphoribosyltransferase
MPGRISHLDPKFERKLREVMFDRELHCPHCRYDLRGLVGSRCPECGREVEYYLRIADLSPGRIRAERFERNVRTVGRVLGFLALLVPFLGGLTLLVLWSDLM